MSAIDLSGKVALITGGSSGIGAAAVRLLHRAGASVFFTYLAHESRAPALVSELGDRVAYQRCNVAEHDTLPALVETCVNRFDRIDVLVNNAATFSENLFTARDYAAWRRGWQHTFDVNIFGAAHLAWLVMHRMRSQRGGGKIINVASRAGHRGEPSGDYGASKAALLNLTKSIARSCASDGIVAMAVAPGFIETDRVAPILAERRAEIESEIPLGYVGSADDVAHVITFLASPLATYTNGATIDINGGSYVR
ncbi:MAG: SDR family oxidoreductase [Candidatus Eremiobacteraeota bacterium]|nr:SDR family oxidoreductase [Candidatus Eremiobacteraeota bacterium]